MNMNNPLPFPMADDTVFGGGLTYVSELLAIQMRNMEAMRLAQQKVLEGIGVLAKHQAEMLEGTLNDEYKCQNQNSSVRSFSHGCEVSPERPVGSGAHSHHLRSIACRRRGRRTNRASATTAKFMSVVTRNTMCQLPVASLIMLATGVRKARRSLGGVEEAQIHGREFRPERVGAGRREQAENLAPGEEDHRRKNHEGPRRRAQRSEQPISDAPQAECDGHGVFAADIVGDPAE
jgi:hypothetical protein